MACLPSLVCGTGYRIRCFASNKRGFGGKTSNSDGTMNTKSKNTSPETRKLLSGNSNSRVQQAPDLSIRGDKTFSGKGLDKKFLDKIEAVKKSTADQKKAEENKINLAIDYDTPIKSDQGTIGLGTKVGIGVAVVVFGLVFALGDFLPYGSVGPDKNASEEKVTLSTEEEATLKKTLRELEEALSKAPTDVSALQDKATVLAELGEYKQASSLLQNIINGNPRSIDAYRLLGEVKYRLKDFDGSASAYKSTLSLLDRPNFDVLRGLTNSLVSAKRPDEAIQVLLSTREKVRAQNQVNGESSGARLENKMEEEEVNFDPIQLDLLIGKVYSDWGHLSDAISVYDALIDEHPDDFRIYLAKGIVLKQNGIVGDAERMFIQAKFFAPEGAKALVDRLSQR